MKRLAALGSALLPWGTAAVLAYIGWSIYSGPRPMDCINAKQAAAISQRAAQICSTELVGCSLSFNDIKQTVAEQEAAKGCK